MDKYSDYLESLIRLSTNKKLVYFNQNWIEAIERMKELEAENAKLKEVDNEDTERLLIFADTCSYALIGAKRGWERLHFDGFVEMCRVAINENAKLKQDINKIKADAVREAAKNINWAVEIGSYSSFDAKLALNEYAENIKKGIGQ